jgi:hypothetical protein
VRAAARGRDNVRIAADLRISVDTVRKWRGRFARRGLAGLADLPRCGRPRRISELTRAAVVALACQLPAATGVPLSRWTGPELLAEITKAGLAGRLSASFWPGLLCGSFVLVDESAEDGLTMDPLLGEVRDGVVGPGRTELPAAMGAPPVVVGLVLSQDSSQVPFAEDEDPVGDLGPGGEHEPFRITVRLRAPGRDLHDLDTGIGQDGVERCGELPGPVADQEPESLARSPRSISRLRICCVVQAPSGLAVTPRMCT